MEYIYLGKVTNTHGLKGEIKIISDFPQKKEVFTPDFPLYFTETYQKEIITTYRPHQIYDMVQLKGLTSIDEVLKYKGKNVYINRADLKTNTLLLSDLIGYTIKKDSKTYGEVIDIMQTKSSYLLYISSKNNYYIPYLPEFITKINKEAKEIYVERVEELL